MGKTRVTVEIDGVARELFSVEERKTGDLMIFLKSSMAISTSTGAAHEEIVEQRFSVHVSPRSRGHTIKQTLKTVAGTATTSALVLPVGVRPVSPVGLLLDRHAQFCWPIFMARPPQLDGGRYDSAPKPADRQLSLGAFNPGLANLVYMVVVTSTDVGTLPTVRGRTKVETMRFQRFNLHVMNGYSLAPSAPTGEFLTYATSPQLNGEERPSGESTPESSYRLPAIEGEFFRGFGILRDRLAGQFVGIEDEEAVGEDGPAVTIWGLSCVCVAAPPLNREETMRAFDSYISEATTGAARSGRIGKARNVGMPGWLRAALDPCR